MGAPIALGSVNWSWSMERVIGVKRWESRILRLSFRSTMKAGRDETQVEEDEFTNNGREERRESVEYHGLGLLTTATFLS